MQCSTCREKEAELTTRWERIRHWLFIRTNHVFYPQDFMDFRSERYTQGYSDGYIAGAEREHQHQERLNKLYGE